ncbi:MAG: DNA translocase FtsK [Candidatus Omnitrophica bacterium]|nr:DNA translocase FtsK [Candidatus Omnitrophota bacterium]
MAKKPKKEKFVLDDAKRNEIWAIFFLAVAVLIFISLVSFDTDDISFQSSGLNDHTRNFAGIIGAYLGWALFFLIGLSSYIIPIVILFWAAGRFLGTRPQKFYIKLVGTLILIFAASTLLSMFFYDDKTMRFQKGGIVGLALSDFLVKYFGRMGSFIITAAFLLLSMLLATEFLILPFIVTGVRWLKELISKAKNLRKTTVLQPKKEVRRPPMERPAGATSRAPIVTQTGERGKPPEINIAKINGAKPKPAPKPVVKKAPLVNVGNYKLPSMDLLDSPPPIAERKIKDDLQTNSKILEETLADFGVEAKVVAVNQGPVITRYELEPAPGVKVNRFTTLADDIALVMKAQSVRIVAPIPGKSAVGVEVPNSASTLVYIKEILESPDFQNAESKLTMALGKDIAGVPIITDLGDMPHLLIAGATGSGKTVCVNTIILSMLFQATPDELKFLMVDPKMVELAVFNDIPHLICPVVTEHKKVPAALDWVVQEMEGRFKLFAKASARNIDIYNRKVEKKEIKLKEGEEEPVKLPYIVVIIDELADLMAIAQREIENAIQRLAQLSRAVGIHIILATQRPSVDVITGVIKANFPARISFKVASKVDSRTVLDMNGADKLLGKGDMLFVQPGAAKPVRAQGSLVTDSEIERVVKFIKEQRPAQYDEQILAQQQRTMTMKKFEKDEIYDEAVRVILETRQASVSMLQRRLGLGYTRAARIIDMMEEEGIVGPYQGSKPRGILVEGPVGKAGKKPQAQEPAEEQAA